MNEATSQKLIIIKRVYFYLVSLIGLVMMVIALVGIINIALKTYFFPKADSYNSYYPATSCDPAYVPQPNEKIVKSNPEDCTKQEALFKKNDEENRTAQRQRELVTDISMILVGLPLFLVHFIYIQKKKDE